MASGSRRGGGSVQPLKEIEAAVIGDLVPVEAIEVGLTPCWERVYVYVAEWDYGRVQMIDGSGSFIGEIGSILVSCPCSLFISVSPWNTQENE